MGNEQAVLDHVLATAPQGDPRAVIAAADAFRRTGGWLMHLGAEKGRIVDGVIEQVRAKRILELGSYFGYSATRMAARMGEGGRVVTLEADPARHAIARRFVAHAGLADRVELLLGRAGDLIPTLKGPFDLVLIDHYGENYLPDLESIEANHLLRPGAAVVADNVVAHRPTVDPYLDHVRKSGRYKSTLHRVAGDGVEVSIWLG